MSNQPEIDFKFRSIAIKLWGLRLPSLIESQMSNIQNLFGHKDDDLTCLISEVSRLQSSQARLEERLAALSAASPAVATSVARGTDKVCPGRCRFWES